MKSIGPTRLKILALIMEGQHRGQPFTYNEIRERMGKRMSLNNIAMHVAALQNAGLVAHEYRRARSLTSKVEFLLLGDVSSWQNENRNMLSRAIGRL